MESVLIPPGAPRRPAAPEETGTADASGSWAVGHIGVHNSLNSCGTNNHTTKELIPTVVIKGKKWR